VRVKEEEKCQELSPWSRGLSSCNRLALWKAPTSVDGSQLGAAGARFQGALVRERLLPILLKNGRTETRGTGVAFLFDPSVSAI